VAPHAEAPAIDAVLARSARPQTDRARDRYRHPSGTLAFFGVGDDANVVELWPGGGYYTSILAPYLASHGHLSSTQFEPTDDPLLGDAPLDPSRFPSVDLRSIDRDHLTLGPDRSADVVLTFRNVHNWIEADLAAPIFAAMYRVLKEGGTLGVVEHRGHPGMSKDEIVKTGYVPAAVAIDLATRAGFRLVGQSEINANPKDAKDYANGVWALPPTLKGGAADRERFVAIGESDRMTLKFAKP
jgi:predicted methyltransferase